MELGYWNELRAIAKSLDSIATSLHKIANPPEHKLSPPKENGPKITSLCSCGHAAFHHEKNPYGINLCTVFRCGCKGFKSL